MKSFFHTRKLFIVVVFFSLLITGIAYASVTTTGLIAYWALDDGTGSTAVDSSSNNHTGTLVNSPTWTTGQTNGALAFSGSSQTVSTDLAFPVSGSVSAWVYPTAYSDWISPAGWKVIGNGYALIDEGGSGSPGTWRAVFNPGNTSEATIVGPSITQNQWTNLIMTWNLNGGVYTVTLYVNGISVGQTTWTGTIGSIGNFHIGSSGDDDDNYFIGSVDEVHVYNRALNSAETGNIASIGAWQVMTTDPLSNITKTSATFHGTLFKSDFYSVNNRGFIYDTDPSFNTAQIASEYNLNFGGFAGGAFSLSATDLACGTTYYLKSYSNSSIALIHGNVIHFSTLPCDTASTVTTSSATAITATSATINTTTPTLGAPLPSTVGIQYGTTTSYGSSSMQSAHAPTYSYASSISNDFTSPTYVAVDKNNNLYVADPQNGRIEVFDSTGAYTRQIGTQGSGNGQLALPQGLAIDSLGNLYVADYNNNRIEVFDSTGTYSRQIGSLGSGQGQLDNPVDVAIDPSTGNLAVADYTNHRIEVFDMLGNYITQFGSAGSGPGQFTGVSSVALDNAGNYYTADPFTNEVQEFDSSGNYVQEFGRIGSGDGAYRYPNDLVIDNAGNFFLSDALNARVQEFDSSKNYITQFGTQGSGNGQFPNNPAGVAVDTNGNVFVADAGNGRIERFAYQPTTYNTTLSGLTCATTYHYQGTAGSATSSDNTFTTSPCASANSGISGGSAWFCTDPKASNYQGSFPGVHVTSGCTYTTAIAAATTTAPLVPAINSAQPAAAIPATAFTMTLSIGSNNSQVKLLQHYLNTHGFPVTKSGVGSLDHENNSFGPATKAAVIAFQKAKRIVAIGVVGPQTRKALNKASV